MVWRSLERVSYIRFRARLWLPRGRCSGIECHGLNESRLAKSNWAGESNFCRGICRVATDTRGESRVGGVIQFRFGSGGFDMKVLELEAARRVEWRVIDGPQEWIGTKIMFELRQEGDWTIILFKHQGWKEPVEFMHHCSTKWGVFLLSLKSLLETGKGAPAPNEIKLDAWE